MREWQREVPYRCGLGGWEASPIDSASAYTARVSADIALRQNVDRGGRCGATVTGRAPLYRHSGHIPFASVLTGDVLLAVEVGGARVAALKPLSGKGIGRKRDIICMLAVAGSEGSTKHRKPPACLQSPETVDGLLHRRCCPVQCHRHIAPALCIAADAPYRSPRGARGSGITHPRKVERLEPGYGRHEKQQKQMPISL